MRVKRNIEIDVAAFELGDIISFNLINGEEVQAQAVKKTDEGMLFITVDCLEDRYPMFDTLSNIEKKEINYFNSDLRRILNNKILDRFPNEIRIHMAGMRIDSTDSFDLLRIPTETEIFGFNFFGEFESHEVKQFAGMEYVKNRTAFGYDNSIEMIEQYWLQNHVEIDKSSFSYINIFGDFSFREACTMIGVRPVFLLSNRNLL